MKDEHQIVQHAERKLEREIRQLGEEGAIKKLKRDNAQISIANAFALIFLLTLSFFGTFSRATAYFEWATEPGASWRLAASVLGAALLIYGTKAYSLLLFGSAEVACAIFSGYKLATSLTPQAADDLGTWAALLGTVYLASKGVENIDKSYNGALAGAIASLKKEAES